MTDELLEQRLRARYRVTVGADMVAPASLRASVGGITAAPRPQAWRAGAGRAFTLLAAAAIGMLLIVGGALFVGAKFSLIPAPSPTATVDASPLPSSPVIVPPSAAAPSASAPVQTSTPTPAPTPTPQPTPAPLVAVYQGLGDTAQILTIDPTTGAQTILGTVAVDSVQLRSGVYGKVQWSSDRRLVTVSRITDGALVTAQMNTATQASTPISVAMAESYVSPQGDRLAGFDGGGSGLIVTDLQGNVLQRLNLPADGTFQTSVAWAPDGSALLVTGFLASDLPTPSPAAEDSGILADTSGGPSRLFVVPLDGSPAQEFGQSMASELGGGAMSPDLSTVVAPTYCPTVCPTGLVSIDMSSGKVTQLTTGQDDRPTWSKDGTRVAFERTSLAGRGIWVMNADGSNLTRLTTPARPDLDYSLSWSPDGTSILFSRGNTTKTGLGDLYVVSASGGDPRLLLNDAVGDW
jgi:WD40-like Beta Propeller Repeat